MTTKSDKGRPQVDCNLRVSHVEARAKLAGLVAKGKELLAKPIQNQQQLDEVRHDYRVWDDFNAEYLRRSFTTDELQQEYSRVHGGVFSLSPSFKQLVDYQRGDITHKITHLESIIERLELMREEVGVKDGGEEGVQPDSGSSGIAGRTSGAQSSDVGKMLEERIQLGMDLASQAIEGIEQLEQRAKEYRLWDEWNRDYVYTLFESKREGNEYANETGDANYEGYSAYRDLSIALQVTYLRRAIGEKIVRLRSLASRYLLIRFSLEKGRGSKTTDVRTKSKKVFIVHGRDNGIRAQVEAFLRKLKLSPIILQDEPNLGQSLMEKIEVNSDVAYAVVLLTGDDEGRLKVTDEKKGQFQLSARPRQNVIFELGFFSGRLGRDRVSAIYEADVELPSDFSGVAYISWNTDGSWHGKLITELKAAGVAVDANDAF